MPRMSVRVYGIILCQEIKKISVQLVNRRKVMLVGGAVGMTQIQKLRYFSPTESLSEEEEEAMMSKYRKQFEREVLEDEQIKQILEEDKDLPRQDWVNIRGPPESSDSRAYQAELRKKIAEEQQPKSKS